MSFVRSCVASASYVRPPDCLQFIQLKFILNYQNIYLKSIFSILLSLHCPWDLPLDLILPSDTEVNLCILVKVVTCKD